MGRVLGFPDQSRGSVDMGMEFGHYYPFLYHIHGILFQMTPSDLAIPLKSTSKGECLQWLSSLS